jgi:hypothetical protein
LAVNNGITVQKVSYCFLNYVLKEFPLQEKQIELLFIETSAYPREAPIGG